MSSHNRPRQLQSRQLEDSGLLQEHLGRQDVRSEVSRKHGQGFTDRATMRDILQAMHAVSSTDTSGFGEQSVTSPLTQPSPYASLEDMDQSRVTNVTHLSKPNELTTPGQLSKSNSIDSDYFHDCESASFEEQSSTPMLHGFNERRADPYEGNRRYAALKTISGSMGFFRDRRVSQSDIDDDDDDDIELRVGRPNLHRSSTDTTGRFLGRATKSAWLQWSHERRASYKRKIETFEKRQTELAQTRLSSPVRKARQESVRFVSPHLETQHLANIVDVAMYGHPAFPFDIPPPARQTSVQPQKEEVKLTLGQWNTLLAFWEHSLFVKARYLGVLTGIAAVVLCIISISTNYWSHMNDHSTFQACHSGLWIVCSVPGNNCTFVQFNSWHISVVGLLLFSALFDMVAVGLSVCGVVSSALPKKIYYYHSSAEIHFLCSVSIAAGIVIYSLTSDYVVDIREMTPHTIGYSFLIAVVAGGCQCAAALFLCLDFIIHRIAKCICRPPNVSEESSNKSSSKSCRDGH